MGEHRAVVTESRCPPWCVTHGIACRDALWHVGESRVLELALSAEPRRRESVDVRAARYRADDSAQAAWVLAVEFAHHVGDRYRVIQLTPADARRVAELLSQAADQLEDSDS